MSIFELYKPGQGKYTRVITFATVMVIVVIGAKVLSDKLYQLSAFFQFGIPTLVVVGLGLLGWWLVNRPKSADFLIATEGEMKKVSWSSRKEVIGSTKVVIATTLLLALLLYGVELVMIWVASTMGLMG